MAEATPDTKFVEFYAFTPPESEDPLHMFFLPAAGYSVLYGAVAEAVVEYDTVGKPLSGELDFLSRALAVRNGIPVPPPQDRPADHPLLTCLTETVTEYGDNTAQALELLGNHFRATACIPSYGYNGIHTDRADGGANAPVFLEQFTAGWTQEADIPLTQTALVALGYAIGNPKIPATTPVYGNGNITLPPDQPVDSAAYEWRPGTYA